MLLVGLGLEPVLRGPSAEASWTGERADQHGKKVMLLTRWVSAAEF